MKRCRLFAIEFSPQPVLFSNYRTETGESESESDLIMTQFTNYM